MRVFLSLASKAYRVSRMLLKAQARVNESYLVPLMG